MYELEQTPAFRASVRKLDNRQRRLLDRAYDVLKETPMDSAAHEEITFLSKRKDHGLFRYRLPGVYIHYAVHEKIPVVTLTRVQSLR
ncbi:MAG: hypothetical protein SFZ03_05380 [Candidatus Melainabacteria bacterium]|nr:hypothetical protein [Candidatus Melainabacteria bacterium]